MFKVEKDFEHNGHRCVVIFTDMGHRCGYVGVNESSPLWCKDYCDYLPINKSELEGEEIGKRGVFPLMMAAFDEDERVRIDTYFDVHGGITFSSGGKESKYPVESNLYWFGFDCAHCNDRIDVDKLREYFPDGKFTESRIESALYFSDSEVRTLEYVTQECMNLADQIAEVEQLLKQS